MRFFFYGTLIAGSGNPVAVATHALLRDCGPAYAKGTLYALGDPAGWYPAMLTGAGIVHGRIYEAEAGFDDDALARLDAYEDFDPASPASSLYLREVLEVIGVDEARGQAQAYSFNRPLPPGARPIPDGDFRGWIAREGLRPYDAGSG